MHDASRPHGEITPVPERHAQHVAAFGDHIGHVVYIIIYTRRVERGGGGENIVADALAVYVRLRRPQTADIEYGALDLAADVERLAQVAGREAGVALIRLALVRHGVLAYPLGLPLRRVEDAHRPVACIAPAAFAVVGVHLDTPEILLARQERGPLVFDEDRAVGDHRSRVPYEILAAFEVGFRHGYLYAVRCLGDVVGVGYDIPREEGARGLYALGVSLHVGQQALHPRRRGCGAGVRTSQEE